MNVAKTVVVIFIVTTFGPLVPLLYLMGFFCIFLHIYMLGFQSTIFQRRYPALMATNLLTVIPTKAFGQLMHVLSNGTILVVMLDLEFGIGPIILYSVVCIV